MKTFKLILDCDKTQELLRKQTHMVFDLRRNIALTLNYVPYFMWQQWLSKFAGAMRSVEVLLVQNLVSSSVKTEYHGNE